MPREMIMFDFILSGKASLMTMGWVSGTHSGTRTVVHHIKPHLKENAKTFYTAGLFSPINLSRLSYPSQPSNLAIQGYST